jgi:uridine kinase
MKVGLGVSSGRVIAIDGFGGSGKSTFASACAQELGDAVVVCADDFYRPRAQQRLPPPYPGGNYDLARLREQVLVPLAMGEDGRYQRYDWEGDVLCEWVDVRAQAVVIVEGTYSTELGLRQYYHYRVSVDAPYGLRLRRGLARDGEDARRRWVDEWMVFEEEYARQQRPREHAHTVLDGAICTGGWDLAIVRAICAQFESKTHDFDHAH